MSLTTVQAFGAFLAESVDLSVPQRAQVVAKRNKTAAYLEEAFPASSDLTVRRVVLIGSAQRGTIIRPLDDIDVLAEFSNKESVFEKYRGDSAAFLQRIRRALQANTSIKKIGARGQAVRLFYTSGAHVDIAPVFKWSGAGFALPSGDRGWLTTDPELQAQWFRQRISVVGVILPNLVKLAKCWNATHRRRRSYHLEVLTASLFASVGSNYRSALRLFFQSASQWLDVSDPAGHSGTLSYYLTRYDRAELTARLREARDRADRALQAEDRGNHAEAKRLWRIELGDGFPVR